MWSHLVVALLCLFFGFVAGAWRWRQKMNQLHGQWIELVDQVVQNQVATLLGGQQLPDGQIVIPMQLVKPSDPRESN